jgi:cytochrome c
MVVIGLGAMIGFLALLLIWRELRAAPEQSGRKFWHVAALLTLTVICMASGRHIYRADNLAPHQALIKAQTDQYMREVQQAQPATVPAQ